MFGPSDPFSRIWLHEVTYLDSSVHISLSFLFPFFFHCPFLILLSQTPFSGMVSSLPFLIELDLQLVKHFGCFNS